MLLETQRVERPFQKRGTKEHLPGRNHCVALVLRGGLLADALIESLRGLASRHPLLGKNSSAGTLVQFADLTFLDAAERDRYEERCQSRDLETPIDAVAGPLLRATLLRLGADVHALTLTSEYSICEPASLGKLVKDLGLAYTARVRQETADPLSSDESTGPGENTDLVKPVPVTRDAAGSLQVHPRPAGRQADGPTPPLLPTDRPRGDARRRIASVGFTIVNRLRSKVKQLATEVSVDEMSVYLAAYVLLVGRFTERSEVVVGLNNAELAAATLPVLLGSTGEAAPVSFPIDKDGNGRQLLLAVQRMIEDVLSAKRGQAESDSLSVHEPAVRPSIGFRFGRLLDLEVVDFAGLSVEVRPVHGKLGGSESVLTMMQGPTDMQVEWHYDENLFDAETIRGWAGCYTTLLRSLTDESESPAALLELTTDEQRRALLAWNTYSPVAGTLDSLPQLVATQALRVPDKVALCAGNVRVSYRALEGRANIFASQLQGSDVRQGSRVGVLLEPGIDLVVAHLGVLKVGAACVPLDPALSSEAIRQVLGLAELDLLVSRANLLPSRQAISVCTLLLDEEDGQVSHQGSVCRQLDPVPGGEEPAFLICSARPSIVPRLAVLPHRALVNCVRSIASRPGIDGNDIVVAFADGGSACFSLELLAALGVGAQVVIAGAAVRADARLLKALLDTEGATVMQAGVETWWNLIEHGWQHTRTFKAFVASDQLDRPLAVELLRRASELWCFYGPLEATGWATSARISDAELLPASGHMLPRRLIGKPSSHATVWVVDEHGELCPVGVPGEIRIGGGSLALAYLNQRPLTAEHFVPDLLGNQIGGKLFRTGEGGRWRHDGVLEHLGPLNPPGETVPGEVAENVALPDRSPPRGLKAAPVAAAQATASPAQPPAASPAQPPAASEAQPSAGGKASRKDEVDLPFYAVASEPGYAAISATDAGDSDSEESDQAWLEEQDETGSSHYRGHMPAPRSLSSRSLQRGALALLVVVVVGAGISWVAWEQDLVGRGTPVAATVVVSPEGPPPAVARSPSAVTALSPSAVTAPSPSAVITPSPASLPPVAVPPVPVVPTLPAAAKETAALAPPKEANAPVPMKEAGALPPVRQSTTPPLVQSVPPPSGQSVAPSPVKEGPPAAPAKEAMATVSPKQSVAAVPSNAAVSSVPAKEAVAPAPVKEAVAPAAVKEAVAPVLAKEAVAPVPVKETIAPAPVKEPVVPAVAVQSASPLPLKVTTPTPSPKEADNAKGLPGSVKQAEAAPVLPEVKSAAAQVKGSEPEAGVARPVTAPLQRVQPPAASASPVPAAAVQAPADSAQECRRELQVLGLCKKTP